MKYLVLVLLLIILIVKSFNCFYFPTGYRLFNGKLSGDAYGDDDDDDDDDVDYEAKLIKQPIDHFDKNENRSWFMRYYSSLKFWKPDSPIFIFIGGGNEANIDILRRGLMYELGKKFKSAMFLTEHRYYGESFVHKSFQYLSAPQAVADLARLLRYIKSIKKFKDSKVVAFGGFYGGTLATWLQTAYPKKVDAVVASSAPVLMKVEFEEFMRQLRDDFKTLAPVDCWEQMKEQFDYFDYVFTHLQSQSLSDFYKSFNICPVCNMNITENQQFFLYHQVLEIAACVFGGTEWIRVACGRLFEALEVRCLTNLFEVPPLVTVFTGEQYCHDYTLNRSIELMKASQYLSAWTYQRCNEFGFFEISSEHSLDFTARLDMSFYSMICSKFFGTDFDLDRLNQTAQYLNELFGGLQPNVTNAIFYNGILDPWRHLGIVEDFAKNVVTIVLEDSSHNDILLPSTQNDTVEMKDAKRLIKTKLRQWLGVN